MLARDATPDDKTTIEALFWDRFDGETADGVATLLRFWSLVGVFSSRRLKGVLLARGFAVLAPAGEIAARLRFNAHWGLQPAAVPDCARAGRHEPSRLGRGRGARRVSVAPAVRRGLGRE